jgi:putative FmdB family regulatory protein
VPIFEFTCRKCGHGFEDIVTLAEVEAGEVVCPACGSDRVERGLSTFATTSGDGAPAPCGAPNRAACGTGGFT